MILEGFSNLNNSMILFPANAAPGSPWLCHFCCLLEPFPQQKGWRVTLRKEGGQSILPNARLASLTCPVPQNASVLAHPATASRISSRADTKKDS